MPRQNVVCSTALLHSCGQAGEASRALSILDLMRADAIEATEITNGAAIRACAVREHWQNGLVSFQDSQRMGSNLFCCNALLTCLEKGRRPEQAMAVLASMERRHNLAKWPAPDVVSYSAVISACETCAWWQVAFGLLSRMQARGVRPNAVSFSALISCCDKGGQPELATQVLRMMSDSSQRPNVVSFGAAISACEKQACWEPAVLLLDEAHRGLLRPNLVCFNGVLSCYMMARRPVKAMELLTSMKLAQLQPDIISFSTVITACFKTALWREALHHLGVMSEAMLEPTCIAYEATSGACEENGKLWYLGCFFGPMLRQALDACRILRYGGLES